MGNVLPDDCWGAATLKKGDAEVVRRWKGKEGEAEEEEGKGVKKED